MEKKKCIEYNQRSESVCNTASVTFWVFGYSKYISSIVRFFIQFLSAWFERNKIIQIERRTKKKGEKIKNYRNALQVYVCLLFREFVSSRVCVCAVLCIVDDANRKYSEFCRFDVARAKFMYTLDTGCAHIIMLNNDDERISLSVYIYIFLLSGRLCAIHDRQRIMYAVHLHVHSYMCLV